MDKFQYLVIFLRFSPKTENRSKQIYNFTRSIVQILVKQCHFERIYFGHQHLKVKSFQNNEYKIVTYMTKLPTLNNISLRIT